MARKILLLIIILVIAAVLGAPFVFGMQAEQLHRNYADKLAAAGSTALKESDFSKGWFKSGARDVLEICSAVSGCKDIVINSVLHHGPIAISGLLDGVAPLRPVRTVMVSRMELGGLITAANLQPALPDLTVTTTAELDGSSHSVINMPTSEHTADGKDGAKLKIAQGGADGFFDGNADSPQMRGELNFPSFRLEDDKGMTFSLSGMGATVDGEGTNAGFIGSAGQKIGSITLAAAAQDPQPLAFKNLDISLKNSRSNDGLSQMQFKGGIQNISAGGREYGPAVLDGEVLRLNRPALTRMQKELDALDAQKKPPQELLPAMMAIYQKGIPEILKSRPEFNLKSLSIKAPEGEISSTLKLVGVPPPGEIDMGAWLQMLQGELSLQIPAATLWNVLDRQMQKDAQQAATLSGQPVVVPSQEAIGAKVTDLVKANVFAPKLDANAYTLQVAFLEGRLLINGQENQGFANLTNLFRSPPPGAPVEGAAPTP